MSETLAGSGFHITIGLQVIAYNTSDRLEQKKKHRPNEICQITNSFVTTIIILTSVDEL